MSRRRNGFFVVRLLAGVASIALLANGSLGPVILYAAPLGAEKLPDGVEIAAIETHPAAIVLGQRYAYAQLVLSARLGGGEQLDITRSADVEWPDALVSVSATGVVRPKQNGAGEIKVRAGGQSAVIPLTVSGVDAEYAASFVRDVMPVMSRLGCNAGTCHGSLNGKNGFKLSLRGYDPLFDHRALTDDIAGRRFNRVAPDQSLMLLKPAGAVPHVGGVLATPGDPNYEILRSWIANGVILDLDTPRVSKIEIFPKNPIVPLPGMKQQAAILATYTDGSIRDVTLEAFIESGNTEVAEADKRGLVTMIRRGEAPLLARYEGAYAATTVTVMGDRAGFVWNDPPANNTIDELVYAKLRRVRTSASELCTDAEFVRRVYLDLIGLPPSPEEVQAFLAESGDPRAKRDALVDRLVGSSEFVQHWTNKWADLLQVNRKFLGERGAAGLRNWIQAALAANMPYDQFVYSVLTASGSTFENPPAGYYKTLRTPEDLVENTTQLFLAVRFNCNKCHDHPFERWTQNQYYHLAAYFAQVGRKDDPASMGEKLVGTSVDGPKALIEDVFDSGSGEEKNAGTGKVAEPQFPYQHNDLAAAGEPRRRQLAKWIVSKENPYFAKSYVNRLWGYLFGRGIIEPIDDIRAGNPPANPELLDWLTERFIQSGFNTQDVFRTICKSATYQRSINVNRWNLDDEINYSHCIPRRLPAEVLYDAVTHATGSMSRLPGLPAGYRAAQLSDSGASLPSGFLELFGRPPRESACECERSTSVMLGPVMTLVNGPTIADAIADGGNAITQLVKSEKDDAKVVEQIFLRLVCRPPTSEELATGIKALEGSDGERVKAAAALAEYEQQLDGKQAAWEAEQGPASWVELAPGELASSTGAVLTAEPDHAILVQGPSAKGSYSVKASTELTGITGVRIEALTDPKLPSSGPGRAPNGNFVLSELHVTAASVAEPTKSVAVPLGNASADFAQVNYPAANAVDNNPGTGWAIVPQTGRNHVAVFETREAVGFAGGTLLSFTLDHQFDALHCLGKFRISVTTSRRPITISGPPETVAKLLVVPVAERTPEQKAELAKYFRAQDPEWQELNAALTAADKLGDKRLVGAQDLVWALINSPAFLFNR